MRKGVSVVGEGVSASRCRNLKERGHCNLKASGFMFPTFHTLKKLKLKKRNIRVGSTAPCNSVASF